MGIRPYKTIDHKIDGAVVTFTGIDDRKREIDQSRHYADAIMATVRHPVAALSSDLRVNSANPLFYRMFQVSPDETANRLIYELGNGQWNIPALRELLEEVLPKNTVVEDFLVEHNFPNIGPKKMLLNARRIQGAPEWLPMILLSMEDVTSK